LADALRTMKHNLIIKFSRHARRRAKLYNISESTVEKILENANLTNGEHEITKEIIGFKYPIKIVATVDNNSITVITTYPLKKGLKDESTL